MEDESFGAFLKDRLEEMDTNARQLSLAMGVSAPNVSNWLHNKRTPSPESCLKLAEVLGLSVDEVLAKAGHRPRMVADPVPGREEIHEIVERLPEQELELVREFARWRLRESGSTPVGRPVRRPTK